MQIEITAFTETDRAELAKLYSEVRQTSFAWLTADVLKQASFDKDTMGEYILVAKMENEPVGFISAWIPDNFIHHLYVYSNHHDRGIGTALLQKMISKLNYPVSLKCLADNAPAIRFYKRKGWLQRYEAMSPEGPYILFELPRPVL